MSIWKHLLLLHGHAATPYALAQLHDAEPRPPAREPAKPAPTIDRGHPLRTTGQLA